MNRLGSAAWDYVWRSQGPCVSESGYVREVGDYDDEGLFGVYFVDAVGKGKPMVDEHGILWLRVNQTRKSAANQDRYLCNRWDADGLGRANGTPG